MRRAAILLSLVLLASLPAATQIRVERDSGGKLVITNKGSRASKALAAPQPMPQVSEQDKTAIRRKLKAACDRRGLDYPLVASLVHAESSFRQMTVSKKGAVGLMQLLPATGERFGVTDVWDLDQNIEGGTAYLAYLGTLFPNDVPLVLAAYNAGENAVAKYGGKIPPYAETVRYVFRILDDYGKPELVARAKQLLATPADYDRFYVPYRGQQVAFRVYYTWIDAKGVRHIADYPPSGVQSSPVVYKDE